MKVNCSYCRKSFNLIDREYRRQIKRGRKDFYCSLVCSGKGEAIKLYGEIITENAKCYCCGNEIIIEYRKGRKKKKYFCSRSCANTRIHSELVRKKISNSIKGKILKPEKYKPCRNCGIFHNNKVYCSKKCYILFEREKINKKRKYRLDCGFNFDLKDYPNEFDFSLIEKFGWYQAKNRGDNLGGVSRDHMYSINEGFENKVDPEIIKHPANCKLLIHSDNSSKWKRSSITLNELKNRIKKWNKKYCSLK